MLNSGSYSVLSGGAGSYVLASYEKPAVKEQNIWFAKEWHRCRDDAESIVAVFLVAT